MKRIITAILLLLTTGTLPAQNPHRPDTRIPYRNINGKLIVDIEVNGRVRPFVFDTGASGTCIFDTFCREIGPDTIRMKKVYDSTGRNRSLPVVRLDSLKIGEWCVRDNQAVVMKSENLPTLSCYDAAGIIGSDILQNYAVRISSRDSCLYLAQTVAAWGLSGGGVKIKMKGGLPYFDLVLERDGKRASQRVLIDTGAEGYSCSLEKHFGLLVKRDLLDSLKNGFGSSSWGLHGREPESEQWMGMARRIYIGSVELEHVAVSSTQARLSFLGTFLLDYGDMTIDYRNKRFYYEPFVDRIRVEKYMPNRFHIARTREGYIVATIWDEETAQRISSGDRVLSFDGRPAEEFDFCDFVTGKLKPFGPGTVVKIETCSGEIVEFTSNKSR